MFVRISPQHAAWTKGDDRCSSRVGLPLVLQKSVLECRGLELSLKNSFPFLGGRALKYPCGHGTPVNDFGFGSRVTLWGVQVVHYSRGRELSVLTGER